MPQASSSFSHFMRISQELTISYKDPTLLLPVIVEHIIDEASPLYGHTQQSLEVRPTLHWHGAEAVLCGSEACWNQPPSEFTALVPCMPRCHSPLIHQPAQTSHGISHISLANGMFCGCIGMPRRRLIQPGRIPDLIQPAVSTPCVLWLVCGCATGSEC